MMSVCVPCVHACTQWGRTPLHWAAGHGHLHVVRYLINQQGAELEVEDGDVSSVADSQ